MSKCPLCLQSFEEADTYFDHLEHVHGYGRVATARRKLDLQRVVLYGAALALVGAAGLILR